MISEKNIRVFMTRHTLSTSPILYMNNYFGPLLAVMKTGCTWLDRSGMDAFDLFNVSVSVFFASLPIKW